MSTRDLAQLAARVGLAPQWTDAFGVEHCVQDDALRELLGALGFRADSPQSIAESVAEFERDDEAVAWPPLITGVIGRATALVGTVSSAPFRVTLEHGETLDGRLNYDGALPPVWVPGYHTLSVGERTTGLAIAPERCLSVSDITPAHTARLWGLSAQIYSLQRAGDGGVGDYTALAELAHAASKYGASALAISPTHAMFSAAPERRSPYSPSSRIFHNAALIDPTQAFDLADVVAAIADANVGESMAQARRAELIDWPSATRAKLSLLRQLHARLPHLGPQRAEFARFVAEGGLPLQRHAAFEARHAFSAASSGRAVDWPEWPVAWRASDDNALNDFAAEHVAEVEFHAFLQWLASRGLAHAQATARSSGMAIGLIADLAVGSDPNGSDAWSRRDALLTGLTIGAPPDLINTRGQNWGLVALSPHALRASGFRAFIDILRATMARAGGVRIDHVLGLMRLWLIPRGAGATEGAYLNFPLDDLLRLIALESHRNRCIVIGEDLGTVAEGFRERLHAHGVLGMDVLWFARDAEGFLAPQSWRSDAVAMTTTHDLSTLAGWYRGYDIELRRSIGAMDETAVAEEQTQRANDRNALNEAMRSAAPPREPNDDAASDEAAFIERAINYVGRSASPLVLLPMEDAIGTELQPNLPGTVDEHPNWRRRMPLPSVELLERDDVRRRLATLESARGPS